MSKQGVGRYFSFIKNKVSSDWKDLAWHLGFETPDIENIDGKHRDDKSRCMDLLQQWYKREGNAATIHVLMEALQDAELQHVVDSLRDKYPEHQLLLQVNKRRALQDDEVGGSRKRFQTNPDLPVHLNLGIAQPVAGDIDTRVQERILELESRLFTVDVLRDRGRYEETREIFLSHKALLKDAITGSFILLLTFLRQTDVDRFYHNHYRVGEGSLSQQLSHILISEHLQDKVKGAQLIVRLQVKHEDYVRVRGRLGQGLDRTTSVDNLLALPSPSKHVDCSSLRGLDLAVISGEDKPYTNVTDDITTLYRQVQSAVQTTREKSKQQVKVQLQLMQGQVKERNENIQQLQETNKNMETMIEELLTAKQPVESGSQQKDPLKLMSDKLSMVKPKATNTGQVKQSVVQLKSTDTGAKIRSNRLGRTWVRKVKFEGWEFCGPRGVAVSQDNKIYITERYNSRIQVFTMDGVYIREFTTTLPGETGEELKPEGVAVDRDGNLWVVGDDHVVQYSREGISLVKIDLPDVEYNRGIAVTMATKQVIVTEYDGDNGRLRVFNQDGSHMSTYGAGHRSPKPWWPQYVIVDGEGNILVTDCNNHCVHVLDREGNFKFKFGSKGSYKSQFKYPRGICVDGMGNIIVADSGNSLVKMFDSLGRFLCHIGSGMKGPESVTVSPGGDVVVTDWDDDTISVWTQGKVTWQ